MEQPDGTYNATPISLQSPTRFWDAAWTASEIQNQFFILNTKRESIHWLLEYHSRIGWLTSEWECMRRHALIFRGFLLCCSDWGVWWVFYRLLSKFNDWDEFNDSICYLVYSTAAGAIIYSWFWCETTPQSFAINMAHSGIGHLKCQGTPSFFTPKSYSSAWSHIPGDRHLCKGERVHILVVWCVGR